MHMQLILNIESHTTKNSAKTTQVNYEKEQVYTKG